MLTTSVQARLATLAAALRGGARCRLVDRPERPAGALRCTSVKKRETPGPPRRYRPNAPRVDADTAGVTLPSGVSFMNVSNVNTSSLLAANVGAAAPAAAPADGDADGASSGVPAMHPHGGGHRRHAVMDALQSLGLTLAAPAGTDPSGNAGSADGSAGAPVSAATSSTSETRNDLHDFMHTLFEAVKGEQATAGGATNGAADPSHASSSFASGLSALVSSVSNGDAPPDLQAAFSKLVSDLSGSAASGAAAPTLQSFLSKLQDAVGYGAVGATTSSGTLMSSAA
jgi:hypothetical protein